MSGDRWPAPRLRTPLAALGVALATTAAAILLMLPAPWPGHVVSSNDIVSRVTPFAERPPVDPGRPRNFQLTDPAQVFRPDLQWARQEVRDGRLPTWSPHAFGGWPLLASQQAAPLYPVSALSYVLPYEASIAWRIIALLVIAALGAFFFGRAIGLGRFAAGLAGVAYGLSGPLLVWSMHPHLDVHATLGWLLLGVDGAARGRRWGVPVLAAAVGCALLGGHPQSVFIDGILVLAWAVWLLATRPDDRPGGVARVLGGGALGLAAAAVVLVPFAELLGQASVNERGGKPGASLEALFTLALPEAWGRPDWAVSIDPPGLMNYVERTAFVGALPILLAAVGLALRRDRLRLFFAGACVVAIVLAYDVPGISSWLVEQWPLRLAVMGRALVILAFGLAMLAGLGLQAVLERPEALRTRAALATAGAVLVVPLLAGAVHFGLGGGLGDAFGFLPWAGRPQSQGEAVLADCAEWAVWIGVGIALLAVLWRRPSRAPFAAGALVAATALGLGLGWHGYLPVMPTAQADLRPTPSIAVLGDRQGDGRIVAGAAPDGSQLLVPNTAEYFGLRDARGRGVPTLARTVRPWSVLGGSAAPHRAFVNPSNPRTARLLRLFGVRAALVAPGAPAPPGSRRIHAGKDGDVYAIEGALPRAFVTCRWRPVGDAMPTAELGRSALAALRERPLVEDAPPAEAGCEAPASPARIVEDEATEVEVEADAAAPSRLVLLDTWYPGWTATVDGEEADISPTNVAFRSVPLPPGRHTVVFSYEPASVRVGAIVSLLAWALIAVLGGLAVRGVRREPARRG